LTTSQLLLLDRQQIRANHPSLPLEFERQSEQNIAIEVPMSGSVPSASVKVPGVVNSTITSVNPTAKPQVDLGEEYEDVDLESYLNTFNTEDTEDIDRIEGIYNIGELLNGSTVEEEVSPPTVSSAPIEPPAPPQPPIDPPMNRSSAVPTSSPVPDRSLLSLSQRQAALKSKAVDVLTKYLHEGDVIVHTEVLKNALGQEVNRKVSTIQRGCPGWAIAQIQQMIS
jgi:hypothetical protein